MACVECVADRESRNPLMLDTEVGQRIDVHCHELGLLVRPIINMCVMSPPLIINREQIDEMVVDPARRNFAHDGRSAQGRAVGGLIAGPATFRRHWPRQNREPL